MPTVSFTHDRLTSRSIATELALVGVCVWAGHNYALAVAEHLDLDLDDGVVRLGPTHFNTIDEVERILGEVRRILGSD